MLNSYSPVENREAVIQYVKNHPEKFVPVADNPNDPEYQRFARFHNGENPQKGFISRFLKKYGGYDD